MGFFLISFSVVYTGSVELVDCAERLPELKRIQGITSWKVTRVMSADRN